MSLTSTEHGAVALRFAEALTRGEFDAAHALLSPRLAKHISPTELQVSYEKMIAYGHGPAKHTELVTILEEWPDKEPTDLGWAYVAISGPGYGEAVTVVVNDQRLIRTVEWGRP